MFVFFCIIINEHELGCDVLIIRRKTLIIYSVILSVTIAAIMLMGNAFQTVATKAQTTSVLPGPPKLVIDAGHGGEDGGAVGADGTMEKDINLDIALRLQKLLVLSGCDVTLTRDSDKAIYDEGSDSLKSKKVSDMKKRLSIFNEDPDNTVISIHQNKFPQTQYSGTQVFYSGQKQESNLLAESIRASVVGMLQPQNTRETKKADKNIYLLYNAQVPAVIVECGFLSNEEELAKLKTEEYRQEMAFAIYCGFLNYYNQNQQGSIKQTE